MSSIASEATREAFELSQIDKGLPPAHLKRFPEGSEYEDHYINIELQKRWISFLEGCIYGYTAAIDDD